MTGLGTGREAAVHGDNQLHTAESRQELLDTLEIEGPQLLQISESQAACTPVHHQVGDLLASSSASNHSANKDENTQNCLAQYPTSTELGFSSSNVDSVDNKRAFLPSSSSPNSSPVLGTNYTHEPRRNGHLDEETDVSVEEDQAIDTSYIPDSLSQSEQDYTWRTSTQQNSTAFSFDTTSISPLPFSYLSVLNNRFHYTNPTREPPLKPLFIHSILQLPATLSYLLSRPTLDLINCLTPAELLNHTTTVNATTFLPSLIKADFLSCQQSVHGLLFLPESSDDVELVDKWYDDCRRKKAEVKVVDADGFERSVDAWVWLTEDVAAQGMPEEDWTLEKYVTGQIVGFGTFKW